MRHFSKTFTTKNCHENLYHKPHGLLYISRFTGINLHHKNNILRVADVAVYGCMFYRCTI